MNNMLLITSSWKEGKTFKMIPTTKDCPFVECIYDQQVQVLAVIGSSKKDTFHMLTKLDANGDPETRKIPARNGNPFKEERRSVETFQEYYIENLDEIREFIKMFATNAATFDYEQYLTLPTSEVNTAE